MGYHDQHRDNEQYRPRIKRRFIRTVEIQGGLEGDFEIPKNQQVLSTRVVTEVLVEDQLQKDSYPGYKVVVVLQGVEYDEPGPRNDR